MNNNQNTSASQSPVSPIPVSSIPVSIADIWPHSAVISRNSFQHKSLSCWSFNMAVGCAHGCRFCYVPETATNKMAPKLVPYGVEDPDAQWGQYVLLREWSEQEFIKSLQRAQRTPIEALNADGNGAVIYSSTTDPYQVIRHADPGIQRELNDRLQTIVTRSLELILEQSTLNVRILTRGPLARRDFGLYHRFGPRLLFGMSVPTLNSQLCRVYEPNAPSPAQRLATLRAAHEAGLHVYVAIAPTYPECDEADLRRTMEAIAPLNPVTIFHEPINIRAENVERIRQHANDIGASVNTDVFQNKEAWQNYAIESLKTVEKLANELGLADRLKLWPDEDLDGRAVVRRQPNPQAYQQWIHGWWDKISYWPTS